MGNTTFSCTLISQVFNYTETEPFVCGLNGVPICALFQMSYAVAVTRFDWQPMLISFDVPVTCNAGSEFRIFLANGTSIYNSSLVQGSITECETGLLPMPFYDDTRLYFIMKNLLPYGESTTFIISTEGRSGPPTFTVEVGLNGYLPSLVLSPIWACCRQQPNVLSMDTTCDSVPFTYADGVWTADRAFDTSCATAMEHLGGGLTQYWFTANIIATALGTCTGIDVNNDDFNITQIVADTGAPSYSPSVDPGSLHITIQDLAVSTDPYLCAPGTVSGYARPRVDVVGNVSSGTALLAAATIWFPQLLWTAERVGPASWTLTSSNCIAQDRDCQLRAMNATARAQHPQGSYMYVANAERAYRYETVECVPRAQCYPDEAENVNPQYPPHIMVDVGTTDYLALNSTWIVDLMVPSIAPGMVVSVDTVSVTITDISGTNVWSQDIGATQKDYLMRNQSYPEYFDGNFCRYNDSLFYVDPIRWNAYVAANIETINATVCAYIDQPFRDRFTFTPENWVFQYAFCTQQCLVTFEVTGQLRDESSGNFTGCVWTSLNVTVGPVPGIAPLDPLLLSTIVAFSIVGMLLVMVFVDRSRKSLLQRKTREQLRREALTIANARLETETQGTPNPMFVEEKEA